MGIGARRVVLWSPVLTPAARRGNRAHYTIGRVPPARERTCGATGRRDWVVTFGCRKVKSPMGGEGTRRWTPRFKACKRSTFRNRAGFLEITNFENRRDRPRLGELNATALRGRDKR